MAVPSATWITARRSIAVVTISVIADRVSYNRKKSLEEKRLRRSNAELEKAARDRTLTVDVDEVKKERLASGALFDDIRNAGEVYGVYEDLFGDGVFTPIVDLKIKFDCDENFYMPVYRGQLSQRDSSVSTFAGHPS